MFGSIYNNKTKRNQEYQSRLRDADIQNLFPETEGIVPNTFDILDIFPLWIRERHASEDSFFVSFVQAYYDWLYSNQSGYKLDVGGLRSFIDIDNTPEEFLSHFMVSYASGFPTNMVGIFDDCDPNTEDCFGIKQSNVRDFIKGVRQSLYQRKTTEHAVEYFFENLYGITRDIYTYYPKVDVLRLNGGRFSGWGASDPRGSEIGFTGSYEELTNLGGSNLNQSIIQDSDWYQDYSYLLATPLGRLAGADQVGDVLYKDVYDKLVHPVGLKVVYERLISDYIPPGPDEETIDQCEMPKVSNYFTYKLNDVSSIAGCSGCGATGFGSTAGYDEYYSFLSFDQTIGTGDGEGVQEQGGYYYYMADVINGITYGGATTEHLPPAGPADEAWMFTGITYEVNEFPTHHYPYWTVDGITGTQFGNIKLGEFYYLCAPAGITSPNYGVTGCTASGLGCH